MVALVGAAPPNTAPVAAFATGAWTRFPRLLAPSARGLTFAAGALPAGFREAVGGELAVRRRVSLG